MEENLGWKEYSIQFFHVANTLHWAADDAEDFGDKFEIIMQLGELCLPQIYMIALPFLQPFLISSTTDTTLRILKLASKTAGLQEGGLMARSTRLCSKRLGSLWPSRLSSLARGTKLQTSKRRSAC